MVKEHSSPYLIYLNYHLQNQLQNFKNDEQLQSLRLVSHSTQQLSFFSSPESHGDTKLAKIFWSLFANAFPGSSLLEACLL